MICIRFERERCHCLTCGKQSVGESQADEVKSRRNKRRGGVRFPPNLNDALSGHVFHGSDHAEPGRSFSCRANTILEALKVGNCLYKAELNHLSTLNLISK